MGISQDISLTDLPRYLADVAARAAHPDLTVPINRIGIYLASEAKLNFDRQQTPDGVPWAAFKHPPSKRRGGPSAKLLRDTDVLMASLTARGAGHVEQVTPNSLLWGTAVPYGQFHQWGTITIPARPFIGVSQPMLDTVEDILFDYLKSELIP